MRTLNTESIIKVIEATENQRKQAGLLLDSFIDPVVFEKLVNAGQLSASAICKNNKALYVVWFGLNLDGGLHVNGAAQLGSETDTDLLFSAIEQIGKQYPYVSFCTKRAGMIKNASSRGYVADCVFLKKVK